LLYAAGFRACHSNMSAIQFKRKVTPPPVRNNRGQMLECAPFRQPHAQAESQHAGRLIFPAAFHLFSNGPLCCVCLVGGDWRGRATNTRRAGFLFAQTPPPTCLSAAALNVTQVPGRRPDEMGRAAASVCGSRQSAAPAHCRAGRTQHSLEVLEGKQLVGCSFVRGSDHHCGTLWSRP
jgi:hypothetical protein